MRHLSRWAAWCRHAFSFGLGFLQLQAGDADIMHWPCDGGKRACQD